MKHKDYTGILPAQYTGEQIEAEASVELQDEDEAKSFYKIVKERLLNVNNWHRLAGIISAEFNLTNSKGEKIKGPAEEGNYLRVDIPGPGSKEGDGYDWVYIEKIKEVAIGDIQSTGVRVRPSENPIGNKKETAHFYSAEATSNFIVKREGSNLSASIIDRNIKPNQHPASFIDKLRNTSVGIGAIGIFSKLQWQKLADGLVKK